jgi:tetratricopeptide (TPR) repeat protein
MAMPSVILPSARRFLVVTAVLFLVLGICSCRRGARNSNANGDTSAGNNDPEKSKREAQALVVQGKELYKNDQDEQALKAFEEAIRLQPDLAEAHLRLGMAYAALERKPEADDSYRKAIELYKKLIQSNPKDTESFFNLGEAHSFLHQDEEAARNYRQATRLQPDDEEAFYQLGMSEIRLAHYPEATAAFKKALELDPDDYRATDAIETAKEGAQRIKEGKKHAEDMLKKEQENENANGNANANSNSSRRPVPKRTPPTPKLSPPKPQ